VDPIHPISSPAENIPPVTAAPRTERLARRQRDPDAYDEPEEQAPDDEDDPPPDDEHPHVDISA